ncbi:hypothetical protein Tco_1414143 [Tanacetum coccineum]
MPWRHPDSCITDRFPTNFNQNHVDRLKAHIVKLSDILERVLVQSGISRVWHNPMCDPVLRRSNNTVISIYDFLCMPSLDKVTVREEPHGLDTSILDRVVDRTTSPAPAVTKADNAAKQKASTRPDISTNVTKKTRSSKKGSGAGSSGQAVGDGVKQTDDGTLDDDDQRDGLEFAMEDIENLNDVSQDKEVEPHARMCLLVLKRRRQLLMVTPDADVDADEIAIDGPYYIPYPYEKVLEVSLLLTPKMIRKKFMESILVCGRKNFTRILRQSDDLKQQNESTIRANEEVSRLTAELELEHRKRKAEEIQGSVASFFQSDFTALVQRFLKSGEFNREFAGVLNTAISVGVELGLHMDRTDEEFRGLSQRVVGFIPDAKEKFDKVVVAFPDTTFLFLDMVSQNSHSSLQDIARLEPDRVTSSYQTSSATASLRANTHVRHSTSSSGTFGHTSTPEHLKKKNKSVEKGGPLAA